MTSTPQLSYWSVQADNWTFNSAKIRWWVEQHLSGRVLNACAGKNKLTHTEEIVRNDLNPEMDAEYHIDVRELEEVLPANSFDTIVYDPPFSEHQADETYNITSGARYDSTTKDTLDTLLRPGGKIIQLGFTSTVMPADHGYALEEVKLWNQLGRQYDWLGVVARKPRHCTQSATDDNSITTTQEVYKNDGAKNVPGGVTTGGNNGEPITVTYRRLPETADLRKAAYSYIETRLTGRTLDVCHTDRELTHDAQVIRNSLSPYLNTKFTFDVPELHREFAENVFDTVVLDLPTETFQRNTRHRLSSTGQDSAVKQEITSLVKPGGGVIQVGHTATCMPKQSNYLRANIGIFAHPDADRDLIVVTDINQAGGTAVQRRTPVDIRYDETDADVNHVCFRCGTGWYHHPVWHVDCPTCGAMPENYCVSSDGTVLRRPHSERIDAVFVDHDARACKSTTESVVPDTEHTNHTASGATTTAQGTLAPYTD